MPEIAERPTKKLSRRQALPSPGFSSIMVRLRRSIRLTDDELLQFCQDNGDQRVEQTATGDLIIMAPVGYEGDRRNFRLFKPFADWEESVGGGECSGSSAGFLLPNGAMRSPDVAWVRQDRLDKLTLEQREAFLPLCPDFVLELRSRTDRLPTLKRKLIEYIANGAQLGWLIDPLEKQVFVYRPGQPVEHLKNPATLSGEPVLAGFTLDLARVW